MASEHKHVLVVDDSSIARTSLKVVLEGAGHRVTEASSGTSALAKIACEVPDLLITDLNMPGMDGLSLVERLNDLDTRCPVLVVTTEASESIKQDGKRLGVKGWVHKPFHPNAMIKAVALLTRS